MDHFNAKNKYNASTFYLIPKLLELRKITPVGTAKNANNQSLLVHSVWKKREKQELRKSTKLYLWGVGEVYKQLHGTLVDVPDHHFCLPTFCQLACEHSPKVWAAGRQDDPVRVDLLGSDH